MSQSAYLHLELNGVMFLVQADPITRELAETLEPAQSMTDTQEMLVRIKDFAEDVVIGTPKPIWADRTTGGHLIQDLKWNAELCLWTGIIFAQYRNYWHNSGINAGFNPRDLLLNNDFEGRQKQYDLIQVGEVLP
jgi:hypothetical protein